MMQKRISTIYVLLLSGILLSLGSCRKVINLDLNSADKKYVVEGNVAKRYLYASASSKAEDRGDTSWVKISTTKNFDASSAFDGISGADVTISDNGGTPVTLSESSTKGIYISKTVAAQVGHTYTLSVKVDGQTFTSSSTIVDTVKFKKMYTEFLDVLGDTKIVADVEFTDPKGKGNAYRFVQYRNGVQSSPIFVQNDELTDGRDIVTQLNSYNNDDDNEEDLQKGDNLLVEMQCITLPVYKFWFSLNVGATGSGQNATPANPESNIQGGAMGYFSAHATQIRSLTVK